MARVNFGRTPTVRGYNPLTNTLKPGHVIQLRGQFYLVDAVEGLTFELVVTANGNTAGTEISKGFDSGYFEDEDLEKLSEGLTKEQVQFIFGTALIQDPFRTSRWDYFNSVTVGSKVMAENKLTIFFNENDLVESWIIEKSSEE